MINRAAHPGDDQLTHYLQKMCFWLNPVDCCEGEKKQEIKNLSFGIKYSIIKPLRNKKIRGIIMFIQGTIIKFLFFLIFTALLSLNMACRNLHLDYSPVQKTEQKIICISPLPDYEKLEFIYTEKDGITARAKVIQIIERQAGTNFYVLSSHGEGKYDTYTDVIWDIKNNFQFRDNLIYCINSTASIRDRKNGHELLKSEKQFDYENKKIICTFTDVLSKTTKKRVFPLKQPVVESALVPYFIKPFISKKEHASDNSFYVVTEGLNLYRITLKFSEPMELKLPTGTHKAIRAHLIPNVGPVTFVSRLVAPDTYIWYSTAEPCDWLKFEGLEADIGTKFIIGYVASRQSAPESVINNP